MQVQRKLKMKKPPFYNKTNPEIYHTCSECIEARNIDHPDREASTGRGRYCPLCEELEKKGNCWSLFLYSILITLKIITFIDLVILLQQA